MRKKYGPRYSRRHDPMFQPEVMAVEMARTIREFPTRMGVIDAVDVILETGKRVHRDYDCMCPAQRAAATAQIRGAGLPTVDGWWYCIDGGVS